MLPAVVIYEPSPLLAEGYRVFFKQLEDYQLAAIFNDFNELVDYLQEQSAQFAIISDHLPKKSYPDAIRFLHKRNPNLKIIAVSFKTSEYDIFSAIKAGASAYLYIPNLTVEQLANALKSLENNEDYFNEPISNIIIKSYVKNAKKGQEISHRNPKNLTRREIQILQLVCEGLTNKQIADGLFISVRTVDAHKNHIMQKLGLKSTAELVKFAIKHGYVKL